MATLISPTQTLSQITTIANASTVKLTRGTLSRNSSKGILPTELKCSSRPPRKLTAADSLQTVAKSAKRQQPNNLPTTKVEQDMLPSDSGIVHDICFLFMETLEIVFFGPYDLVQPK